MNKPIKTMLLIIVCGITLILSACTSASAPTERGIHGMISRIEYGDNVAYIFGSMHAGQADWFPLNIVVEDAMRRADKFLFEYDLSIDHSSPYVTALMNEHMFLPIGTTLEQILPKDVYEIFVANAATFNTLDYDTIRTMQPMAIASLATAEIYAEIGIRAEHSVDLYVFRFAQTNNLPIAGLNTIADELSTMSAMPLGVKIASMSDFPDKQTAIESNEAQELAKAYRINDIEKIRAIFTTTFEYEDNIVEQFMQDIMLHRRGHIFADEIERLLRETEEPTTFFITVGLAHIIGGDAGQVLYHLRDKGFDIVRLYNITR